MFQYLLTTYNVNALGWFLQTSAVEAVDRSVCTIINGNILNIRPLLSR